MKIILTGEKNLNNMIIIRQKFFAAQDYAGVKTAFGAKWLNLKRNFEAGQLKRQQSRHKRQLGREMGRLDKITDPTGANKGMLNEKTANVVKQNMLQRYNEKNDRSRNNVLSLGTTTTKNNPTTTYIENNPPKPAATQPKAIAAPSNPVISPPRATTTPTTPAQKGAGAGVKAGAKFGQFMKNNGGKMALGAAAVGTGAYLLYKRNQKKKEEEQKAQQASGSSAY